MTNCKLINRMMVRENKDITVSETSTPNTYSVLENGWVRLVDMDLNKLYSVHAFGLITGHAPFNGMRKDEFGNMIKKEKPVKAPRVKKEKVVEPRSEVKKADADFILKIYHRDRVRTLFFSNEQSLNLNKAWFDAKGIRAEVVSVA